MTTKTDDIKLLACPFCGGQNLDIEMDDPPYVMCHDCGAYGPDTLKPDARPSDVAEVWNRRAAVESARREYLDTLKLAREIVNGHRRDNPPEDSVEADRQGRMPSDAEVIALWQAISTERGIQTTIRDAERLRALNRVMAYRYGSSQPETGKTVLVENQDVAGQPAASAEPSRCEDCPPVGYPTDETRCAPCDRRSAPAAQEPVGYLACNPETGKPEWGEGCICENNVYSPEDTGTVGRPVVFAASVVQGRPVVNQQMTTETKNIRTSDPYDDPIFERLCREHEIWGTPQSALCAVFWRSSRASVQNREDAKAQIVAEYNRWTHAHASGQSYDDFLKSESAARAAKGE